MKKKEAADAKKRPKMSAAQLRVQKGTPVRDASGPVADVPLDLTELELPDTMKTDFPDPSDVLNFKLTITPDEGSSNHLSGAETVLMCCRDIQGRDFPLHIRDQSQLPSRAT